MSLRWLWFDHIPPELHVPKEARELIASRAAIYRAEKDDPYRTHRRFVWLWLTVAGVTVVLGIIFVEQFVDQGPNPVPGLLIVCFALFTVWFYHRTHAVFTRRALCERGYLCCVKCGYPHTGLSKDVKECPECGAAREFGNCIHCNTTQDWPMQPDDRCTQCGRKRLS